MIIMNNANLHRDATQSTTESRAAAAISHGEIRSAYRALALDSQLELVQNLLLITENACEAGNKYASQGTPEGLILAKATDLVNLAYRIASGTNRTGAYQAGAAAAFHQSGWHTDANSMAEDMMEDAANGGGTGMVAVTDTGLTKPRQL